MISHRSAVLAFAALTGITLVAPTAEAQMPQFHPSFYGSAEADTRQTQFYLLGMYLGEGKAGWSPYLNVNGYSLHYPKAGTHQTLSAIAPTVGLAYAGRSGGVSFGGGYTWVNNEDPGAPGAEGGGSNGATASVGAYHNGSGDRPVHTQLLSNYNFGSQYFWARGRASVPFGISSDHPARIGAEVVGQSGGKDGRTSNSFQFGPTLEYAWTPSFRTTGAIGYKSVKASDFAGRESATYFKIEFSFSP